MLTFLQPLENQTYYRSLWSICLITRPLGQLPSSLLMTKVIILAWAHTRRFDAGTHILYYPESPAEGQSLLRGQVWNMPVFSLMTRSTINTAAQQVSVRIRRCLLPAGLGFLANPAAPSWSSSRLGAGGAPVWHMHSTVESSSHMEGRRLTHIAAQGDQWDSRKGMSPSYFHPQGE